KIAREVSDILSDNNARAPEFGTDSPLQFDGYHVADKTGTTNDSRDAWVIGYTPGIAVGAWAGNNDNTPMVKKIAAFIIAPMWHDFMAYAIQKYPSGDFPPPAPETDQLPPVLTGNWNTDPSKGVHDILYWVQKDNPRGGPPVNPWADPQAAYWDYPVQQWAAQGGAAGYQNDSGVPGTTPLSSTTPTAPAGFHIMSPMQGATIAGQQPFIITSEDGSDQIANVTYYVNGVPVGMS